jgi:hypothetical protein
MSDTIAERVTRGAKLLDQKWPGWASKIKLNVLAMDDCVGCVLGQLAGDYEDGATKLFGRGRSFQESVSHGFHIELRGEYWDALQDAWLAEIAARRRPVEAHP